MKKQTAKNAVCTFHDMVSKKVMISKKISMVEDSDLWNFHFPSSTNMPNEEDTSKRRMDRTEGKVMSVIVSVITKLLCRGKR